MKNLKKAFCLVLTFAMLMSMMVFTSGAANFTDNDEIESTEAVDTCVALNIINGKGDGSYFDPTGIVTRGEMAKMICVALNSGKDPQLGSSTSTYTDTVGHWAAGYIDYCTNLGIVSGRGAGIFDPNATVTGTEAAKMLLVAIGYDSDAEVFTGASWAMAVNVRANQKDLYDELSIDPNAGLTRDAAAQMVYNAVQAVMVEYDYKLVTGSDGTLSTKPVAQDVTPTNGKDTILEKKFDMITGYSYLLGMSYDSVNNEYTYSFDKNGYTTVSTDALAESSLKSSTDYSSLFGQKVKVMYKNNTDKDVYGIYADEDSKVLASGVLDGIDTIKSDSFKFGGVVYKTDAATTATNIYTFDNTVSSWAGLSTANGTVSAINAAAVTYSMKLIDDDGDGKVDYIIATPFTIGKVTYVGTSSVTAGNNSYKYDDCDIADGLAKDDYAIIYDEDQTAKGKDTLVKANVVTGTVTAMESSTKIALDGTTYKKDASYTGISFSIGSTYKLVVVSGYYFNAEKISGTASTENVVLVCAQDTALNTISDTLDVQLLFADGTKKVVSVSKVNIAASGALADVAALDDTTLSTGEVVTGQIYTYEIDSDGYYELSMVVPGDYDTVATAPSNTLGGTGSTADPYTAVADGNSMATLKSGKTASVSGNTYYFDDDAVIFYNKGTTTPSYKVTTGATVNKWADLTTAGMTAILYANKSNGFNYTELGLLNLKTTPDAGDLSYGWITANPQVVKDGDDYYLQLTIFNGTTTEPYLADKFDNTLVNPTTGALPASFGDVSSSTSNNMPTNIVKGAPIAYSDNGDGTITNVYSFKSMSNAVAAYADGSDDVVFAHSVPTPDSTSNTLFTVEDDTTILYVDTENNAGVEGGAITTANEPYSGTYVNNCYILANDNDEIKVIVLDTTNVLAGLSSTLTPASTTADGLGVNGTKVAYTVTGTAATDDNAVELMFSNAIAASVSATTAVVYAPDGTAYTYSIVVPYAGTLSDAALAAAGSTAAAAQSTISGYVASGATLAFAWNYAGGGTAASLVAGDKVTVTATAANGEVMTFVYTIS